MLACSATYLDIIYIVLPSLSHSTQEAYDHVRSCRQHIQPLAVFGEQLTRWEAQVLGETRAQTDTSHL